VQFCEVDVTVSLLFRRCLMVALVAEFVVMVMGRSRCPCMRKAICPFPLIWPSQWERANFDDPHSSETA